jgi:integrase
MAVKRFTFTRAALRDLRVPKRGRVYYYDALVAGLSLCAMATGVKSFRVCRKFNGRSVRITLGLFDAGIPETHELPDGTQPLDLLGARSLNVRMARKLATAVNASLDVGVNPTEKKSRLRKELTLGELFEHYHDHLTREGKKGVPGVIWNFQRYLGALPSGAQKAHGQKRSKAKGSVNWQQRRVSTIQRGDASRLRLTLAEHISPTTANRVMELLKAIFNFGTKHDLFSGENPAAHLPKFKLQSRQRRIESHEARKFFEELDSHVDEQFRDYVYLSICTGARRGNLLRMRWDEVSLDGMSWRLAGEKMKNGDPLVIPLIPKAVAILKGRAEKASSPWVFPGNTPEGHAGPFRKQWAQFIEKAGVPNLRIHDLRRTLGSWMSSTGASTVMTMRALGHKTIDAALVYQRLETASVRDAMATGVGGLLKAAEPEKPKVIEMPRTTTAGRKSKGRKAKGGR